jgi:hypothetical protein
MVTDTASESRPVKVVHMRANLTMETFMDKAPTHGGMAGFTRASSLKIKAMASDNKNTAMEFTRGNSKTTNPMELDSSPTQMGKSIMDNGKMDCFTASAQCTLSQKNG